MDGSLKFSALKEKQRAIRAGFPETMGLRVHRAISWVGRSEACDGDDDARFLFLWIAFNAAYADEREFQSIAPGERAAFLDFFGKLVALDKEKKVYKALWQRFTRTRELLVLPWLDATPSKSAWIGLVDLSLADLPDLDVSHLRSSLAASGAGAGNTQTRALRRRSRSHCGSADLVELARTSRDENATGTMLREEEAALWKGSADDHTPEIEAAALMQDGRERGLILHKLMEEALTREIPETEAALTEQADHLILALGQSPVADPAAGLSAQGLAACVTRIVALPDIAALRPGLLAEFPVYSAQAADGVKPATAGIADTLTVGEDGRPIVVVDWKSDVNPDAQTLDHYRAKVRGYLDMTGAERGLIVLMTRGTAIAISPSSQTVAA
ncbi:exodeoxyribonuclease-5 [Defluviimonas denitrificans]|jgi:exodeoxyribonuclease-5|uniref:Exodeoxyribonuclease-5 n=1 Tax=Albidovulum denitrificans TaxID=404881 RepID=A0A2S8SB02_9RHOB|nr:hypothetical protein [Defluviimonas denitrificans]PQV57939.1 exodeoxyribonuclease-5 [Defluviimonas denitrificans]